MSDSPQRNGHALSDRRYGVVRRLNEQHIVELDEWGFTVIPDVLPAERCEELAARVDEIWAAEQGHPDHSCNEVGVQFTGFLLHRSAEFAACVENLPVLAAVGHVLDDDPRLSLVIGRRADPGYGLQPLHDLERRRGRPFVKCNTTWCLDDFTASNGATRMLPGTHLDDREALSLLTDPLAQHPLEVVVEAVRGSVIVMNSHLIHAGTTNRGDRPRRCIHSAFVGNSEPAVTNWSTLPAAVRSGLSAKARGVLGVTE